MARLRTIFQFSITLLLCVSAATFAAAEGSPLVACTIPVGVFAWLNIDRPRRAGLGSAFSFLLGLAALAAAGFEFLTGDVESRLLAPAHLLAYFVCVILLQRKEHRHYWMLLGLSVLQIALASLLTSGPWLGLSLVIYAVLALWAMGVFTLHRAVERIGGDGAPLPTAHGSAAESPPTAHGWDAWRTARSSVRNAVQIDPDENIVGWHFAGGASVAAMLSLVVTSAFFLLIPRVWSTQLQLFDNSPLAGNRPLTGFTAEVTLGDMGEILESNDLVMEIELFDHDSGRPIPLDDYYQELGGSDPLFRGQVLETYQLARWTRTDREAWRQAPSFATENGALAQRVRLQPIGTPMLFGAGNVLTCIPARGEEPIYKERNSGSVRRSTEADLGRVFQYEALSSRRDSSQRFVSRQYLLECLSLPQGMEPVGELAFGIVAPDGNVVETEREAVGRLEAYLRDSPEFSYSLDLSIDDPGVDPVVDFLFNRRQGHCEYYASALTLMLRTVGIPSRMVSGFKGGQINSDTGRYEVRQLHAHAWTEAFIDGGWTPFDPTPPAREESVAGLQEQSSGTWSRFRDRWNRIWNQGVRLSKDDQDELVYSPIRDGFAGTLEAVRDLRGTGSRFSEFVRSLATSPDRWFSWRGGFAAFILLLLLAAAAAIIRRLAAWLARVRGRTEQLRRGAALIHFYERFRKLAARAGLERRPHLTQQEFADVVQQRMHSALSAPLLSELPGDVARQYYRVRFGAEHLSDSELQDLLHRLDEFEAGIAAFRQNGTKRPRQEHRS